VHVDDCVKAISAYVSLVSLQTGYGVADIAADKSWRLTDLLKIMVDELGYNGTVTLDNNRHGETLVYKPNSKQLLIIDRTEEHIKQLCSQL